MIEAECSRNDPRPLEIDYVRELRELYDEVDREVNALGPVCDLSGRCCRFLEYGHTLFVSSAEAVFLLGLAPTPASPLDEGASCPWQDSRGHCTAREARPLGCRIYHCDPAFQEELHRLSERFIDRLKKLSSKHNIAWNYAPLHRHLHEARRQNRFPPVLE
jgi:Fe-S-cluster containining protein